MSNYVKVTPAIIIGSIIAVIISTIAIIVLFDIQQDDTNSVTKIQKTITISTIHRDPAKMTDRFQPMADYIAFELSDNSTKYKGKVVSTPSEKEMIENINEGNIDIYLDSSLIGEFVSEESDIFPALLALKENTLYYHSVFFVPKDSDITMDTLEGHKIIFEDMWSSSGYLLPKYHLLEMGYSLGTNSDNVTFEFSNDDENTPIWVLEGRGDIGVSSNIDFEDIPENIRDELKIIGKTVEIPRQIVYFSNDFERKDRLTEIFLNLDDAKVLKASKISGFSIIDPEVDLKKIKMIVNSLKQQ